MRDYPCRFEGGCRKKTSGCNYLHPGDPDYELAIQKKASQDSRSGTSSGRNRFAATASNTTALPQGPNRWGKPSSPGKARLSANDTNASSAWNFMEKGTTNEHNSSASMSQEQSSGWGSTDNNIGSTSDNTGWSVGGADSTWATDDAMLGWGASSANGGGNSDGWGAVNSRAVRQESNSNHDAWDAGSKNGGWGTSNSGANKDDRPKSNPNPDGWGARSGGWGDGAPGTGNQGGSNDAWGAADNGGWGKANAGSNKGWGPTTDSSHANTQGQPTTSNFGSWGSLETGRENIRDAHKDKAEGKKTDDVQMRDPSPPRKQNPKSKPIPTPLQIVSGSPTQTPLSPKYTVPVSAVSAKFSSDLKSVALEVMKQKAVSVKVKGAEGRKALYKSIIKHTKNAIIAFIEYREAQTDLNRWKDTQMSTIYGHATQKTRKILNCERATFHRRLQDVEDAFQKEINALVNLPEVLTTIHKKRNPDVLTKEIIAQYTQELQEWVTELELHKRLLMEKKKAEDPEEGEIAGDAVDDIAEEKEEGEVIDREEGMTRQKLTELLQAGQITWKELIEAIQDLETQMEATQENVYFDIFTCIDDHSKEKLSHADARLESIGHEEPQDAAGLPTVSQKISTNGKKLEGHSDTLARLLGEIEELEKQREAVQLQTKEARMVCQMADRLFGEFEQWKEKDNAQIKAITEQVELLHLHNSSGSPKLPSVLSAPVALASTSTQPGPISTTELIDPIRKLVVNIIHKELESCFDNLRSRCMENQEKLETEMEQEARRIMTKAEIFKRRIAPGREPSAHPVVAPGQSSSILSVPHSRAPT